MHHQIDEARQGTAFKKMKAWMSLLCVIQRLGVKCLRAVAQHGIDSYWVSALSCRLSGCSKLFRHPWFKEEPSCISPAQTDKPSGLPSLLHSPSISSSPSSSPDGRSQLQIISWAFGRMKGPKYLCRFLAVVCLFPDVCGLFSVKYFP